LRAGGRAGGRGPPAVAKRTGLWGAESPARPWHGWGGRRTPFAGKGPPTLGGPLPRQKPQPPARRRPPPNPRPGARPATPLAGRRQSICSPVPDPAPKTRVRGPNKEKPIKKAATHWARRWWLRKTQAPQASGQSKQASREASKQAKAKASNKPSQARGPPPTGHEDGGHHVRHAQLLAELVVVGGGGPGAQLVGAGWGARGRGGGRGRGWGVRPRCGRRAAARGQRGGGKRGAETRARARPPPTGDQGVLPVLLAIRLGGAGEGGGREA
jgi:hypothetical protein